MFIEGVTVHDYDPVFKLRTKKEQIEVPKETVVVSEIAEPSINQEILESQRNQDEESGPSSFHEEAKVTTDSSKGQETRDKSQEA